MNRLKKYIFSFAVVCYSTIVFSQTEIRSENHPQKHENGLKSIGVVLNPEDNTVSSKSKMNLILDKMSGDAVMRNAAWGLAVYDPKTKKLLYSHNENTPLIPASTTKILTTETALSLLGGKFRWITQLDYSGEIDPNGTLNGNLYIVGSGDPSLGTLKAGAASYPEIVSDFISALVGKGIKRVTGNIIIQTGVFKENKMERLPANIVWIEVGNYYLPAGDTKDTNPENERYVIRQKSPFDTDSRRYFYISPRTDKMAFTEEFSGKGISSKIPDAPSFLAKSFKEAMSKRGIGLSGNIIPKMTEESPEQRLMITAYKSPVLSEIVYDTNQRSDNALAESLLRMVGFQKYGNQNAEMGKMVVTEHLERNGFDMQGLNYADGSGLSRSHRITPVSQVKYLSDLMKKPYFKDFYDSLPIAGQSGTLRNSFGGIANGQISAKTGTLNKVKTLAGYIKTFSGKTLVFSLLINNYTGSVSQVKHKMEELLSPLVEM